jgi:hypothetical protein
VLTRDTFNTAGGGKNNKTVYRSLEIAAVSAQVLGKLNVHKNRKNSL